MIIDLVCVGGNPRGWLRDGIKELDITDLGSYSYRVRCESSHLTSFSVLVDIVEVRGQSAPSVLGEVEL